MSLHPGPLEPCAMPDAPQPSAWCSVCGCDGGCVRAGETGRERDTTVWVARAALGMMRGNEGAAMSLRAVLECMSPELRRQDATPGGGPDVAARRMARE